MIGQTHTRQLWRVFSVCILTLSVLPMLKSGPNSTIELNICPYWQTAIAYYCWKKCFSLFINGKFSWVLVVLSICSLTAHYMKWEISVHWNFHASSNAKTIILQFVSDKVSEQRLIGLDWHQRSKPREAGLYRDVLNSSPTARGNSRRSFYAAADAEHGYC